MLSVVWFVFAAAMVAAAVIDVISYRIPNLLVLGLLVLFVLLAAINWREVDWFDHLAAAILVFGAGVFLYAFRQMGAGDVKLLGVVALWSGVVALPALLLFVALSGLLALLVIIALRMIVPRLRPGQSSGTRTLPRVLTKRQGIPYAIAIGPGALVASFDFASWLWRF